MMGTPTYSGSLNPEELIDWVRDMEKLFDMEQIEDSKSKDGLQEAERTCIFMMGYCTT